VTFFAEPTRARARARETELIDGGRVHLDKMTSPQRHRLPNRRLSVTQDIVIGNLTLTATVGFDHAGRPAECSFAAQKTAAAWRRSSMTRRMVISVALQHGIRAAALAKA